MKRMRPIKLEIKGLNSFIEKQTIDFDKLTKRGLFGIFGPTGQTKEEKILTISVNAKQYLKNPTPSHYLKAETKLSEHCE